VDLNSARRVAPPGAGNAPIIAILETEAAIWGSWVVATPAARLDGTFAADGRRSAVLVMIVAVEGRSSGC